MTQVLLLTLLLTSVLSNGQTRTITGRVLFDDLSPGYQVKVWTHDTLQLGTSGVNGDFTIELPTSEDEMEIGMIGMEIASVKVPPNCYRVDVILIPEGTYHYRSHKKIDRMRKRLFDKIPELHSNAFAKGLFGTPAPCFTREFRPDKPQLDEIRKELGIERKRIKTLFSKLEIGDTIQVPFSGTYRVDGTERTTLTPWAYFTDATKSQCLIEGIITNKDRQNSGYNIEIKITDCKSCKYDTPIIYREKDIVVGTVFRHDMKILKVLTK
jgi:hypothetical protein